MPCFWSPSSARRRSPLPARPSPRLSADRNHQQPSLQICGPAENHAKAVLPEARSSARIAYDEPRRSRAQAGGRRFHFLIVNHPLRPPYAVTTISSRGSPPQQSAASPGPSGSAQIREDRLSTASGASGSSRPLLSPAFPSSPIVGVQHRVRPDPPVQARTQPVSMGRRRPAPPFLLPHLRALLAQPMRKICEHIHSVTQPERKRASRAINTEKRQQKLSCFNLDITGITERGTENIVNCLSKNTLKTLTKIEHDNFVVFSLLHRSCPPLSAQNRSPLSNPETRSPPPSLQWHSDGSPITWIVCTQQKRHMSSTGLKLRHFTPQILSTSVCTKTAAPLNCSCETKGNPPPILQWHSDELSLNHLDNFALSKEHMNGTGLRSFVTVSLPQERGFFTLLCRSSNSLGSVTQRFYVGNLGCLNSAE
ncbi:sialic acid-binding Ig-like lectin 14, partial [Lates japonicus]